MSNPEMTLGSYNQLLEELMKLFPEDSKYYFVQSKVGRARNSKEVRDFFKSNNRNGNYFESIEKTIKHVKRVSKENDVIFVGGSTFVVSEVLQKK